MKIPYQKLHLPPSSLPINSNLSLFLFLLVLNWLHPPPLCLLPTIQQFLPKTLQGACLSSSQQKHRSQSELQPKFSKFSLRLQHIQTPKIYHNLISCSTQTHKTFILVFRDVTGIAYTIQPYVHIPSCPLLSANDVCGCHYLRTPSKYFS